MNTILFGWADETMSSRAWRMRHKRHFKVIHFFIDTIFFFEKNHCEVSFEDEVKRLQSPVSERGAIWYNYKKLQE